MIYYLFFLVFICLKVILVRYGVFVVVGFGIIEFVYGGWIGSGLCGLFCWGL